VADVYLELVENTKVKVTLFAIDFRKWPLQETLFEYQPKEGIVQAQ